MSHWTATDDSFFRMVAGLFPADVVFGAGVLLASYDDEVEVMRPTAAPPVRPARPLRVTAPV